MSGPTPSQQDGLTRVGKDFGAVHIYQGRPSNVVKLEINDMQLAVKLTAKARKMNATLARPEALLPFSAKPADVPVCQQDDISMLLTYEADKGYQHPSRRYQPQRSPTDFIAQRGSGDRPNEVPNAQTTINGSLLKG